MIVMGVTTVDVAILMARSLTCSWWSSKKHGTPLYSRSDGLFWFLPLIGHLVGLPDFLGNHAYVHGKVQAGDIYLKTCPRPGSNLQPCALQSTALTTRPPRLIYTQWVYYSINFKESWRLISRRLNCDWVSQNFIHQYEEMDNTNRH